MGAVRFALVGYGAWGSHHARAIHSIPEAFLAAIVECNPESRQKAQAEHPQARVLADCREMLATVDVDAVDAVLPTHLHHAVGHEFRLSALWEKVKELIDAGAIGDPLYALIELWRNPYRQGSDGWRYDIRRVGNWILEEPTHFFDLVRWYFSAVGEPVSVYARANGVRRDRPELQDNFSATLEFPGGRYAVVSQTLAGWEHHQVVKITGTQGAIWASWSGIMDRTAHPPVLAQSPSR
jgi:myo-inositol 2-dehydrogenase/D-chiro-inositol 1-dehydrogenase